MWCSETSVLTDIDLETHTKIVHASTAVAAHSFHFSAGQNQSGKVLVSHS